MLLVDHDQGSQEWLSWRQGGIGGSDAPVIMGVSPYETKLGLWQLKLGRKQPQPDNPGMQRGRLLEEPARRAYEAATGEIVTPQCAEHEQYPFIKASFDGLSLFRRVGVEIKCPGEEDHALACLGIVPPKYWPQVQHLMLVSGYDEWHYWSYDGEEGVLVVVQRDPVYIGLLLEAEMKFWNQVVNDIMPVETEALIAAGAWRVAHQMLEQAEANLEWSREQLLKAANFDPSVLGSEDIGLATIINAESPGPVDWKQLAADKGIDDLTIESYRKPGSSRVSIRKATATKTKAVMEEMAKREIPAGPISPGQSDDDFQIVW